MWVYPQWSVGLATVEDVGLATEEGGVGLATVEGVGLATVEGVD